MLDKLTDSEIVKACKDCLHYEACKGTYSSAKGDEDILCDFDGEMYADSGCEDFKDKNLINRLQAENERLQNILICFMGALGKVRKLDDIDEISLIPLMSELNKQYRAKIKAEAYKECIDMVKKKGINIGVGEIFITTNTLDNLLKELVGE